MDQVMNIDKLNSLNAKAWNLAGQKSNGLDSEKSKIEHLIEISKNPNDLGSSI